MIENEIKQIKTPNAQIPITRQQLIEKQKELIKETNEKQKENQKKNEIRRKKQTRNNQLAIKMKNNRQF